ncbi:MAG: hypothetical protein P8N76_06030 [Pirellulaceae bacterium]|nr:hypothetical protein [Pirellulaceae bacterium]
MPALSRTLLSVLLITPFFQPVLLAQNGPSENLSDLEPFVPRTTRSEADEDRIHSSSLFAEGRLLFRREKYLEALRKYERAHRYSNGSETILKEIVPLAFRLGHGEEAARYAKMLKSGTKLDSFILRRLAVRLTEQERFEEAAKLYEITAEVPAESDLKGAGVITQFELGRLYFLNEKYGKASDAFDRVLSVMKTAKKGSADAIAIETLLKDSGPTYSVIGESNFLANRLEKAAELFRKAHPNEKTAPILAFHLARIAKEQNKVEAAEKQLAIYLEAGIDEAGTSPYRLLAELEEAQGRQDQLIKRLVELREQQPQNAYIGYFLADQYLEAKQYGKAAELYQQVLQQQPSVDAYRGLVTCYQQLDDDRRLLELLGRAVTELNGITALKSELTPLVETPERINQLAVDGRKRFGDHPEKELQGEALALANLAILTEQYELADEFFRLVAGKAPRADAQLWISWGLEMLLANESERAIQIFQEMLDEKIPGRRTAEVLYYLSGALAVNDRYDEALLAAKDAAKRSKGIPAIEMRPAWILYLAERWDESKQAYLDFLDQYQDDFQTGGARAAVKEAKMTLSNICVAQENIAKGIEWLEQVLDEYPMDVGAHNDLGYLWADQNLHLNRALRMAQKAVAAEPENIAYLDSLGWALYQLARYQEAVEPLQKAIEIERPDPIILEHLADTFNKLGQAKEARETWQKALKLLLEKQANDRKRIESKLELERRE